MYFSGQILALDSGKTHLLFSSHAGFLTYAVHYHGERMKQSTHINIVIMVE